MAKNYIILCYILCITLFNSCSKHVTTVKPVKVVNKVVLVKSFKEEPVLTKREQIQKAYTAELHVRERTGNNDGKRVEEFLAVCGLGKGNPWCAAFVAAMFKWNGVIAPLSGYSPNWFPKANVIWTKSKGGKTPQTGDVGGLYYKAKGRIAHVFFIDDWGNKDDNFVSTVEGNTSLKGEREGQGVERLRRLKMSISKISIWIKDQMLKIIVYQTVEDNELINKAGIFEDKKLVKILDYKDLRYLLDKNVDIFDCNDQEILKNII